MQPLEQEIKSFFKGEIHSDDKTLTTFSHDASLLEVKPELVLMPKDADDIKNLIALVNKKKTEDPSRNISITGRSAGTDMSGGPLSESIILSFTEHFATEDVDLEKMEATVQPGVYYHNFETETLPEHVSFPVYPASKDLAAFGGMVMNNCAGERSLRYGQMRDFVEKLHMILADGNQYEFKKLTMHELDAKMAQNDFEGELYKKTFELISNNYDLIKNAKPKVSKNSSGYALWRVWDREKGTFDLSQLFVGSQGTLGVLTDATVRLVKEQPYGKLVALFFDSWDQLPDVVNAMLPFGPESLEAFDDATMRLGIRFMPEIAKKAHMSLLKFAWSFVPEVLIGVRMLGMPKLIVLVEIKEETEAEMERKKAGVLAAMKKFPKVIVRPLDRKVDEDKYWIIRRESFSLLRKHVGDKRTAPFIDDFCIQPKDMPAFLPKLLKILKDNKVKANIAGHAGDGNYHIIPLMDMRKETERAKIAKVLTLVVDLIVSYGGTITAEHNDGIIRTPFVQKMFGPEVYGLFEQVKKIFDPQGIFNPGKKVGGSLEYMEKHIAKS